MSGVVRDNPVRRQPKYRVHAPFEEWTPMPSIDEITVEQLSRLIGLPAGPRLIDVRAEPPGRGNANLLPTARHLSANTIESWGSRFRGMHVVVYCQNGGAVSQGAAAWLRNEEVQAEVLAG